jgi:hypothetical protein
MYSSANCLPCAAAIAADLLPSKQAAAAALSEGSSSVAKQHDVVANPAAAAAADMPATTAGQIHRKELASVPADNDPAACSSSEATLAAAVQACSVADALADATASHAACSGDGALAAAAADTAAASDSVAPAAAAAAAEPAPTTAGADIDDGRLCEAAAAAVAPPASAAECCVADVAAPAARLQLAAAGAAAPQAAALTEQLLHGRYKFISAIRGCSLLTQALDTKSGKEVAALRIWRPEVVHGVTPAFERMLLAHSELHHPHVLQVSAVESRCILQLWTQVFK